MKISDLTMKVLADAAKDMNEELGLEPKIKTVAIKREKLIEALQREGEDLREGDNLKDSTVHVLEVLGCDCSMLENCSPSPVSEKEEISESEEEEVEIEDEEEAPPVKKEKKEKSVSIKEKKEVRTTEFGSREGSQAASIDNVLLKKKPKTIEQIAELSGQTKTRVKLHINHLKKKGFDLEKKEGEFCA